MVVQIMTITIILHSNPLAQKNFINEMY